MKNTNNKKLRIFKGKDIQRFWSKVDVLSKEQCWNWKCGTLSSGYGQFWLNGINVLSHRASWVICKGKIPDNLYVLHKCDNPSCVNPDHLFLGNHQDNMDDEKRKGRTAGGTRRGHTYTQGVLSGNSKLSEDDVAKIYWSEENQYILAKKYGVSQSLVSMIKNRHRWGHMDMEKYE